VTLDVDGPVLTRHSERLYSRISDANIVIPEVLLVPLRRGSEQIGTLWIVADRTPHFDRGQVAAISELADFVSVALQMLQTESRLKSIADRHEALAQEMSHRVKNAFAMVQGLIHFTAQTAKTKDELTASLSGRVRAMGDAHALVRRSLEDGIGPQKSTDLDALLEAILRPHEAPEGHPQRFGLNGPTVSLGGHAANNFALVFHELATNAAKYGALSNRYGRVEVEWTLDDASLTLNWREAGGPPITAAPRSAGFGSRAVRSP
jgi:two-component sensor histidine kinase